MAATVEEPFYHRKGDRSPEDAAFHNLQPQDKQMLGQIRAAMDGAREKMNRLRDDVEDKERDISRESALRKAAETRLDQLVDMYGDPAVNEELRQRLPRAIKSDVRVQWQKELEDASATSPSRTRDVVDSSGSRSSHSKKRQTKGGRRRRLPGGSGGSDVDSESEEEEEEEGGGRRRHRSHSNYPPGYPPMFGAYPSPPYPGYVPQMYPVPHPMMYAAPPQGTARSDGVPLTQSTPVAMQPTMQAVAMQPVMMSPNHIPQTGSPNGAYVTTTVNNATAGQGSTNGATLGASNLSVSTPNLHAASLKEASASREQNRQISRLLAELDAAKDLNKKLQGELCDTRQELDSVKITLQTKDAATEADIAGKAAELVEEIYRAQQQRDQAMMGRLRLANEARDEALLKLRTAETSGGGYEADTEELVKDTKLQELLSDLDLNKASSQDLNQQTRDLLNTITATQQRKKQLANEEMRAVMMERDAAVAKNKQYEADMLRLQRQARAPTTDKQQLSTLQAKLLSTQQERDLALNKARKLEEELQTLRVYYSLHKSLSQEANLRDQFNNTLHTFEGQLHQRDNVVDAAQKENNKLVAQLQMLTTEKDQMLMDLDKAEHGRKEAQVNCDKLERLVNVLRRKINGLGSKNDE